MTTKTVTMKEVILLIRLLGPLEKNKPHAQQISCTFMYIQKGITVKFVNITILQKKIVTHFLIKLNTRSSME